MIVLQSTLRKDHAMCRLSAFFRYFPVTEETMSCGMYVTGAGRATVHPGDKYPPSGHPTLYQFDWLRGRTLPEFQLMLISDGAGEFESRATGHLQFEEGALILIFPGVWHRYRPSPAVGWTERWFTFNGETLNRLFDIGPFGPKHAVTSPRDAGELAAQFDEMLDQVCDRSVTHPAVLAFQAMRIISEVVVQQVEDAAGAGEIANARTGRHRSDPVVERALEIIWTHSPQPMSVTDIARQLPVTRRTLDRRFMEATGHSVLEEINACRLSRAKRLLTETELPVKTVAHLAGFNSTERMRVVFVEREGISPTSYRKRMARPQPGGSSMTPGTSRGGWKVSGLS
jgi:AraC-like DNA-binding protein